MYAASAAHTTQVFTRNLLKPLSSRTTRRMPVVTVVQHDPSWDPTIDAPVGVCFSLSQVEGLDLAAIAADAPVIARDGFLVRGLPGEAHRDLLIRLTQLLPNTGRVVQAAIMMTLNASSHFDGYHTQSGRYVERAEVARHFGSGESQDVLRSHRMAA